MIKMDERMQCYMNCLHYIKAKNPSIIDSSAKT